MNKIVDLYGISTEADVDWPPVVTGQHCPFLNRKCLKNRKSEPGLTIGSCTVSAGKDGSTVMIRPFRLLERNQIFMDCIHLLAMHEPGNELHVIPGLSVPCGSIDYCLASVRGGKPVDFVGIVQTLDTTGTVWSERQRFLHQNRIRVRYADRASRKPFGLNWKMTAKTILVQLHHKIHTVEHVNKHLVLVSQDHLTAYMRKSFSFDHLRTARLGDSMHFHSYTLEQNADAKLRLQLIERLSTDGEGIAKCLGLQSEAKVELEEILTQLESKLSSQTLLSMRQPPPAASLIDDAKDPEC